MGERGGQSFIIKQKTHERMHLRQLFHERVVVRMRGKANERETSLEMCEIDRRTDRRID